MKEGISANSTSFLEFPTDEGKPISIGNPTEAALLLWLYAQGIDYLKLRLNAKVIEQLAFSTERKYMTTLVHSALLGKDVLYIKGAPEIVAKMCSQVATSKGLEPIENYQQTIEQDLLAFQSQGMRTLGFAYKMNEITAFLGYVAISDPVRPDVPAAVKRCQSAGIQVKIVTGDTPATATEIGRQIGLWTKEDTERNRITGTDFAALTEHFLALFGMSRQNGLHLIPLWNEKLIFALKQYTVLPLLMAAACLPVLPKLQEWFSKSEKRERIGNVLASVAATGLLILSVVFLLGQTYNPFIYFRF